MTSFEGFHERFSQWVDDDDPPDDFRFWVMAWLWQLCDDPYYAATPADMIGLPWWFARIPNAEDDTHAVTCLYSIEDGNVRCGGITTLRKPIS